MASGGYGTPWSGDRTTQRNYGGRCARVHDCHKRHWNRAVRRERGDVVEAEAEENQLRLRVPGTVAVGVAGGVAADVVAAGPVGDPLWSDGIVAADVVVVDS